MAEKNYPRPPITEAVIELRFETRVEFSLLERAVKSFRKFYPNVQKREVVQYEFGAVAPEAVISPAKKESLFALSTADAACNLTLSQGSFIVSQLPDYPGWDVFFGRMSRDWKKWRQIAGYQKLARIGVRYINRLDLPVEESVAYEDQFLAFNICSPDGLGNKFGYTAVARFALPAIMGFTTVNSGMVQSPIENTISVLLDIDVERTTNMPSNEDDLHDLLGKFRIEKNRVFELCITDKARERFE